MQLETDVETYSFNTSRYESWDLEDPDIQVKEVFKPEAMRRAAEGTSSCLFSNTHDVNDYFEVFAESDNVHFYDIDGAGYARAVELETTEGNALAVDGVKTAGDIDSRIYRAGVNSIFHHAEIMNKDVVLGGEEFFRYKWSYPLDLTYDQPQVTPAEDVFFEQTLTENEIHVRHEQKPYTKGEQWDESEEYFVSWL